MRGHCSPSTLATRGLPVLAGLLLVFAGCQEGQAPTAGAFVVRDSAGIEIVESMAPAWDGDGWTVSGTPSLVIGQMGGDERYLFGEVAGAVMLRDGRIAVLDGQSALIRVYSPEGEHIEDWGGQGEGPGEFTSAQTISSYRGDSILVSEFVARRLVIFDDRGRLGRSIVPEMRMSFATEQRRRMAEGDRSTVPGWSCCRLWGSLRTGAFLLSYPEMIPNEGSGTKRASVTAAIMPDAGGAAESVGVFGGMTYELGLQGSRSRLQLQPWFNMVPGPDGYYATQGDSYSIDAYDLGGNLRRIIRLARETRPVTDEIKAAYEAGLRDRLMAPGAFIDADSPEEMLDILLAGPYPPHLPTFFQLLVDPDGNIWAGQRRYGAGDSGAGGTDDGTVNDDSQPSEMNEFIVFGADGRYLGMVELTADFQVLLIGTDFILGALRDDLGVACVHVYRIEK